MAISRKPKANMKNFFNQIKNFVSEIASEKRIPESDKKILAGVLIVLFLRIFLIPDWIPYTLLAPLDIFLMLALVLDYFFQVLDSRVLLSHYPWGMKSFARLQRIAHFMSFFIPSFISDNLWKYIREPF